jgi:hypothetical protein
LSENNLNLKEEQTTEWPKDTEEVIRLRKSKKNRQHNGQKKKNKSTNNDLPNIHIKHKKNPTSVNSDLYLSRP